MYRRIFTSHLALDSVVDLVDSSTTLLRQLIRDRIGQQATDPAHATRAYSVLQTYEVARGLETLDQQIREALEVAK